MRTRPSTLLAAAVCCALAFLFFGCNSGNSHVPTPLLTGSGVIVSEFRTLAAFDSVDAGIAEVEIVITQGGPQSVWIETDDNIIAEIETIVFGTVLQIFSNTNYATNHGVVIHIDMASVASLRFSGVGTMDATGISSAGTLEVVFTGVGSVDLAGTVDTYDAVLEGLGDIDAEGLTSRLADIELRGLGDCRITVTEQLNGAILGTGNIYYAGNPPTVIPNIVGIGNLIPI